MLAFEHSGIISGETLTLIYLEACSGISVRVLDYSQHCKRAPWLLTHPQRMLIVEHICLNISNNSFSWPRCGG